jgi:pimeloyl-ACP methyl ester carboxylesterase
LTVAEHSDELAGTPVFWRAADGPGTPVLYVHGVPTSSDIWTGLLERSGGIAPDLPGFGRSGKGANLEYSAEGHANFLERLLARLGIGRVRLVVHDWGAGGGLVFAQRHPERIERLVIVDSVPLLPGYRWHRVARAWRTPVVGELAMGSTGARTTAFALREAFPVAGPPQEFVDQVVAHFDHGTQRAILRLYRGGDPDVLARLGERLGTIQAPALVLWGERDPYIPPRFAAAYAQALPHAEAEVLPGLGHWPWLEDPAVGERITAFLAG